MIETADSMTFCLSKGLCAPVGSIIVGTAHFIAQMVTGQVSSVTRIAHGVPLGGEIEYTDGGTLAHALQGRRNIA